MSKMKQDASEYPAVDMGIADLDLSSFLEQLQGFGHQITLPALKELLGRLELTESYINRHVHFDSETYQRNLVARTEYFEVLILCFEASQRTPIHDHAGSACGVKVIDGVATETIFERSEGGWLFASGSSELGKGGVVGSVDKDIHQLANLQSVESRLVTLHVYSPPLGEVGNYSLRDNSVKLVKAAVSSSKSSDPNN